MKTLWRIDSLSRKLATFFSGSGGQSITRWLEFFLLQRQQWDCWPFSHHYQCLALKVHILYRHTHTRQKPGTQYRWANGEAFKYTICSNRGLISTVFNCKRRINAVLKQSWLGICPFFYPDVKSFPKRQYGLQEFNTWCDLITVRVECCTSVQYALKDTHNKWWIVPSCYHIIFTHTLTVCGRPSAALSRPAGHWWKALPGLTRPSCLPKHTHTIVTYVVKKIKEREGMCSQRSKVITHPAEQSLHAKAERHPWGL